MNYRQQNKIDEYHSGRMSADEVHSFEKELASDPSLQAESDFQSDIISGLKAHRKMELKSRLDAVDIGPVWFEFVQQSTLMKSFGGVAVATLVGTGVYFMAEPKEDTSVNEGVTITIDAPYIESKGVEWNIQPALLAEKPVAVTTPMKDVADEVVEAAEEGTEEEVMTVETKPEEAFSLNFNAPNAEDIKDEEALEVSSLDELPENSLVENEPIEVDYETTKALDIKYKYYDGKLFLSGDFDRAPYEILEINSANGRRIYVKYLEKYYSVKTTDKLTALPQVTDVRLINELNLLRQNK